MKSILIANPKGGSGKSTLSTNLAGYLAQAGHRVNPLFYSADKNLVHRLRILRDQWRYPKRYASAMEKANP